MSVIVIPTDLVVQGNASFNGITIPAGAIADSNVAASANISGSKIQQTVRKTFAADSNTTVAAETKMIYLVLGATTTIQNISAGMIVPAIGTDTATVDVKKNGTSILSAPISLTSAQSARQAVAGAITTAVGVAGDVYEVVITPTHVSGTLGTGVFCELKAYETAT